MRRLLLNLSAGISLIVCLAVCAVWVRSFYVADQRTLLRPSAVYQVMSNGGVAVIHQLRPADGEVRWVRPRVPMSVLGVEVIEGRLNRRRPWRMLLLPYWVPAAAAMILPAVWLMRRAKRQGARPVCPVCGDELAAGQTCAKCATSKRLSPPPAKVEPRPALPSPNPRPVAFRRAV